MGEGDEEEVDFPELAPAVPAGEAPGDPLIGAVIDGRYRIDALLSQGGMGRVYKAWRVLLKGWVAIKVPLTVPDAQARARFLREARSAHHLRHPGIIEIFDFGELPDGRPYLVMAYLRGRPLGEVIRRAGVLEPARALRLGRQIAEALQVVHAAGVLHRDLKPDNIFLAGEGEEERATVLDFGLVQVMTGRRQTLADSAPAGLTGEDVLLGTPEYMSPEQAQGHPLDPRADQYALGCILYEMLGGELPFSAGPSGDPRQDAVSLLFQHVHAAPVSLRTRRPDLDLPPSLDAVVLRALSKRKDERFGSMRELGEALTRQRDALALPRAGGGAADPPVPAKPALRGRRLAGAVLLGAAVGALVLGAGWLRRPGRRPSAPPARAQSAAPPSPAATVRTPPAAARLPTPAPQPSAARGAEAQPERPRAADGGRRKAPQRPPGALGGVDLVDPTLSPQRRR